MNMLAARLSHTKMDSLNLSTPYAALAGLAAALAFVFKRSRHHSPHLIPQLRASRATSPEPNTNSISLVSYNILNQAFATPTRFPRVQPPHILQWDYRWPILKSQLQHLAADIFSFQEVTDDRWEELRSFMADQGYANIRQGPNHEVLLAVFFKVGLFSVTWCEHRSRALLVELELIGPRFEPNLKGQKLYLVNVHLEGKPNKPEVRVSQLRHALERLARHIESTEASAAEARLIINGDFNSRAEDAPSMLLRRGKLEGGYTEPWLPGVPVTEHTIVQPFSLVNSYEVAGMKLGFTHKEKGDDQCSVLDHVWVSGKKEGLEVKGVLNQMKGELLDLAESQGLPNKEWPSDHVMVGCMVEIHPL